MDDNRIFQTMNDADIEPFRKSYDEYATIADIFEDVCKSFHANHEIRSADIDKTYSGFAFYTFTHLGIAMIAKTVWKNGNCTSINFAPEEKEKS